MIDQDKLKEHLLSVIADKASEMSRAELGEIIGIHANTASWLMTGKKEKFSVDSLIAYCQALGVSVEYKINGRIYRPETNGS